MNKVVKRALTYGLTGVASFGVGYVMQPAPTKMPNVVTLTRTVEGARALPVPDVWMVDAFVGETIVVEKEPTPHPTDCLVMRWTR